ncbi:hypothetical protein ACVBEF_09255 [Glaciimonas sp. GG7]
MPQTKGVTFQQVFTYLKEKVLMNVVRKLTLGFRPDTRAFRVESMRGLLIDTLLDARGIDIPIDYYANIATGLDGVFSLMSEGDGNLLLVDKENIFFTKSAYSNNGHIDLDKTFKEFMAIFGVIQRIIKFKGIRRIGLIAEHRFNTVKNNNTELLATLTKLPVMEFPAHFTLHYENRAPSTGSSLDTMKGAFTNCIHDFYDSALDTSVPIEGKINANIDYQKYYAPSLNTKIVEETEKHFFAFKKELKKFDEQILKLGFKK